MIFSPAFEAYKSIKSVLLRTKRETGDRRAVMSIQDCQFCGFSVPQLFLFFSCRGRFNCVDEFMNENVEGSE